MAHLSPLASRATDNLSSIDREEGLPSKGRGIIEGTTSETSLYLSNYSKGSKCLVSLLRTDKHRNCVFYLSSRVHYDESGRWDVLFITSFFLPSFSSITIANGFLTRAWNEVLSLITRNRINVITSGYYRYLIAEIKGNIVDTSNPLILGTKLISRNVSFLWKRISRALRSISYCITCFVGLEGDLIASQEN